MAQVMVNFRIDEEVKRSMEQACREMGLSMTAAFTLFATKVGREKRIPFEIAAGPPAPCPPLRSAAAGQAQEEELMLAHMRERSELLCAQIRRSLTAIHTAIPSSITGLSMERIRLLCGDELKDKTAGAAAALRRLFAGDPGALARKDLSILRGYLDGLSSVAEDLAEAEHALIPAMRAWTGGDPGGFEPYAQELAALSRRLDELAPALERFSRSTAQHGARAVRARIEQAGAPVGTDCVRTALEHLEGLVLLHYDALEAQTRARLEGEYLQTLELALRELAQAEQGGGDAAAKAALCLRAADVLTQVISSGAQARREWDRRSLEAEVTALERLAALRGDLSGGMRPEG